MSLRVWLPLNGDLTNNGLSNVTVTNSGATVDNNGKIGKCYSFSSKHLSIPNPITVNNEAFSISCWVYITGYSNGYSCIFGSRSQTAGKGIALWVTSTTIRFDDGEMWSPSYSFQLNTWTHITAVWSLSGKYIYVNGNLISSKTSVSTLANLRNTLWIGDEESTTPTYCLKGKLNDFRIYDHALSAKEVKELSKGLVCHYKLDSKYSTNNLIINGFGENGAENWISSNNISTTEVPSGHPEIKASYYNGNIIKEYIPINPNHSYTISAYLKTLGATTGTTYPSIYPYDYDKKFIWTYNCSEGFSTQYKTTLAQPLKKGDTVIYATNLSAWTTGNNYYFHVAIFGYKDSSGYTYPDMIYTADSPAFGTKTDKSHIDKTNNTITLNAPFTGEDRPAGTTICQATEGSTYYYPFGGVALANIQDWTFKTMTFTPKSHNRLKACKYIKWQAYSGAYYAGNKLVDNNDNNSVIYDSSGYNYHGTPTGNLTVSSNSARNSLSTVFNGIDSFIEAEPLPIETKTISIWLKTSWSKPSSGYRLVVHDKNTGLAIGFSSSGAFITYVGSSNGSTGSQIPISSMNYTANQWNHIVVVKTGNKTRDVYVNGIKITPSGSNYWGGDLNKLDIGCRHLNGSYSQYFDGQLSDFRAYATALSADDIKELYQTSASIDKDGNMFAYEFKED